MRLRMAFVIIATQLLLLLVLVLVAERAEGAAADELLSTTRIVLYHGPTMQDRTVYRPSALPSILDDPHFDVGINTVMYIHGFREHHNSRSVHEIVNAYYSREDYNILFLDWSYLASDRYLLASVLHMPIIASGLAEKMLQLFDNGMDINSLHLVGHSLGGQMIGEIGRQVIKQSNGTQILKRLSALDPAFPGFYMFSLMTPISKTDAEFVDIIHTAAWTFGAPFSTGTVDFWPNGGLDFQPSCSLETQITELCSHRLSWGLWAESVSMRDYERLPFLAVAASSWDAFKNTDFDNEDGVSLQIVEMGINCPANISGNYYLHTNTERPYAKGVDGIGSLPKQSEQSEQPTTTTTTSI